MESIQNDDEYNNALNTIDYLMSIVSLSKNQEEYLESLVQLVQIYEEKNYSIDRN